MEYRPNTARQVSCTPGARCACLRRVARRGAVFAYAHPNMAFPPVNTRLPRIWHGGDYNPEQWPASTWDDDVRLMQQAHFGVATVGVFSWVSLQPAEDRFTFDWLDQVFEKLAAADRFVCLATPTAAQPAWMSRASTRPGR